MGLYDRQYFRNSGEENNYRNSNSVIWWLIAINALFYFIASPNSYLNDMLALYSNSMNFRPWQLITAGFLHANLGHIIFNMWGLHIFGTLVTPHIGGRNFVILYLAGVLSGNLLYITLNWGGSSVLLGASGAVCAVMMAAAMLEPNRRFVMLFLPFSPIKTPTLVICYTVIEILMLLGKSASGISHLAHLGGFIGGYILIKFIYRSRLPWDPLRFIKVPDVSKFTPPPVNRSSEPPPSGSSDAPVTQRELDALLDKLSRGGVNSLSEAELARLRQAREQMRTDNK